MKNEKKNRVELKISTKRGPDGKEKSVDIYLNSLKILLAKNEEVVITSMGRALNKHGTLVARAKDEMLIHSDTCSEIFTDFILRKGISPTSELPFERKYEPVTRMETTVRRYILHN